MTREYRPEELTYERKLTLLSDQVDMTRRMRMSELFRLLEEVSVAHTEGLGCTRAETLDKGLLWVITRQLIEIEEMPVYDDEITIRGWQGDMMHVFFPRFYEVEKKGRVIIRGQALWALIDEATREIIMPEDYGIFLPGRPDSDDMMLPAIVIPKTAGEPASVTKLVTGFSQMDINGHMNNTSYFNMIDDAIWADVSKGMPAGAKPDNAQAASSDCKASEAIEEPTTSSAAGEPAATPSAGISYGTSEAARIMPVPKSLYINYMSEIKAGTELTLKEYKDAGTLYFEGAGEKPFFRVKLTY